MYLYFDRGRNCTVSGESRACCRATAAMLHSATPERAWTGGAKEAHDLGDTVLIRMFQDAKLRDGIPKRRWDQLAPLMGQENQARTAKEISRTQCMDCIHLFLFYAYSLSFAYPIRV